MNEAWFNAQVDAARDHATHCRRLAIEANFSADLARLYARIALLLAAVAIALSVAALVVN